MRIMKYIWLLLLVVACKNAAKDEAISNTSVAEENEVKEAPVTDKMKMEFDIDDDSKSTHESMEYRYDFKAHMLRNPLDLTTASKKLQEYYDLKALINNHPEFSETATARLEAMGDGRIQVDKNTEPVIDQVRLIQLKPMDSLYLYKAIYIIDKKEDSLLIELQNRPVIIDNDTLYDQEIKFKSLDQDYGVVLETCIVFPL